jgi:hypothetical protein
MNLSRYLGLLVVALLVLAVSSPVGLASHAVQGVDVKVTNDNNNVDGGTPNPSFDAQNRQSNETTVSINPVNPDIVAVAANDYRMVTVTRDVWYGLYVSDDGGSTWFNTMVPGFPSDTSAAGEASPLKGLAASGDPVVRFDADGNLYAIGIAFNRVFNPADRPLDTVVYSAKYDYTPGTPGGTSTPNSAGNPPNFTYSHTTIVDRGAVGFAVPSPFGFAGVFTDKEWAEIDNYADSPCFGNIYVAHTNYHGAFGNFPVVFSRSTDGGETFSSPRTISTGGTGGTSRSSGVDIAVSPDGTVHVAYEAFRRSTGVSSINALRSTDCGRHWTQPVVVGTVTDAQAPGVNFRTPTFGFIAADDTDSDVVYVGYQNIVGDFDIYVHRSTNGGATWGPAVQVNTDPGAHHQIFPTIDVSNGTLHAAWYDMRNSAAGANDLVDVYYRCSNCNGAVYPSFDDETRVTDISHNGNCLLFGGGTAGFHGDYNELDSYWDGANNIVHVAWADHRDVSPCDLDPAPGPPSNNTGNRNENIYADTLTVGP